jgi:PIN domain
MLHSKGRIDLPLPFPNWLRRATAADMLTIVPLDAEAVIAVQNLPQTFHGDPADRMIVATARVHDLPLATHDEAIRKSRLVKIWKSKAGLVALYVVYVAGETGVIGDDAERRGVAERYVDHATGLVAVTCVVGGAPPD